MLHVHGDIYLLVCILPSVRLREPVRARKVDGWVHGRIQNSFRGSGANNYLRG